MKPRRSMKLALPLIIAALTTASASAAATAQDKKGSNLSDSAPASGAATPAEQLVLGYRLADYARTVKDARAMTVAARIVDRITIKQGSDQGKLDGKGAAGASTAVKPPAGSSLFAEARQFAAGDAQLLAEIDAAQAEASRGCACGAISITQYVPGGMTWTVRFAARGGDPLVIGARRDSATPVDLKIYDENGNLVCQDMSHNVTMYCRVNPIWSGPFSAQAINHGEAGTGIAMVTN